MACGGCSGGGCSCAGKDAQARARPITLSGLSLDTFEFNTPGLPDSSYAGWGLVLKGDVAEATLDLKRRFHVSAGGGGLSSPGISLYVDGNFTRMGISASAFNATLKPQATAMVSFVAYPLKADQLLTWPRFGWIRTEFELDENEEGSQELSSSTVDWVLKFDPDDVWTVQVQGRTGGNWSTDGKIFNLTSGSPAWQFSGGLVTAQPPTRLKVSHDKAGTVAAVLYEKVAL